jgi:hypothetical protein
VSEHVYVQQFPPSPIYAQEVCLSPTPEGSPQPGSPPPHGFASLEEQQQYLDLEREVAEMQKMLEEATAAAEIGQQSHSDQQYLSEILGELSTLMVCVAICRVGLRRTGDSCAHEAAGSCLQHGFMLAQPYCQTQNHFLSNNCLSRR